VSELRRTALEYAGQGWPVFPLIARGKLPAIPQAEGGRGFHDATTDTRQIERWWTRWPHANIGFCPGRARILVIDQDGPDAARVAMTLGLFAEPVPSVISGRAEGGRHLYFAHPGGTVGNLHLGHAKLEVRADNGYVILPPSVHPDGPVYAWEDRETPLVSLPPQALRALRTAATQTPERRARDIPKLEHIPEGERHTTLRSYAARLVALGHEPEEAYRLLQGINHLLCHPPYADGPLWELVRSACDKWSRRRNTSEVEAGWPRVETRRSWA
jgi:putative DNA primase/helicase